MQKEVPGWSNGLLDAAQVQSLDFLSHLPCSYLSKPPTLTEFKHKSGKSRTISSHSNVLLPAETQVNYSKTVYFLLRDTLHFFPGMIREGDMDPHVYFELGLKTSVT